MVILLEIGHNLFQADQERIFLYVPILSFSICLTNLDPAILPEGIQ